MENVARKMRMKPAEDLMNIEEGRTFIHSTLLKILDNVDDIRVESEVGENTVLYRVSCNPADLGKLIGARGKNIYGLRTLVAAIMARKGQRSVIEIPFIPKKED